MSGKEIAVIYPVAARTNRKPATREAQLAIRDTGRAKEAGLPVAVPGPIGRNAPRSSIRGPNLSECHIPGWILV